MSSAISIVRTFYGAGLVSDGWGARAVPLPRYLLGVDLRLGTTPGKHPGPDGGHYFRWRKEGVRVSEGAHGNKG